MLFSYTCCLLHLRCPSLRSVSWNFLHLTCVYLMVVLNALGIDWKSSVSSRAFFADTNCQIKFAIFGPGDLNGSTNSTFLQVPLRLRVLLIYTIERRPDVFLFSALQKSIKDILNKYLNIIDAVLSIFYSPSMNRMTQMGACR